MAFFTVETLEVLNILTYAGTETGQYPLSIYRPWFRTFFTIVVPLACANYLPAQLLLGRDGAPPVVSWLSPIVGVLFLIASLGAFRIGIRRYLSTGS